MLLVLLIFIMFSACIVFGYRNKFAYIMSLYFFGCAVLMFSGFFYFITISWYQHLSKVDYAMLQVLSSLKIDIYDAATIHNIGIVIIMIASVAALNLTYRCKWWVNILLMVPVVYTFYMNLPSLNWSMFLKTYVINGYGFVADAVRTSSVTIVVAYLFIPFLSFGAYTVKTKIFVKKRYGATCLVCMVLIYTIIYLLFVDGVFTPIMFYNIDLMGFPKKELGMYTESGPMIFSVICIIAINVFIILYFKPFEKYSSKRKFAKRSQMINENIYMLLHTYKNNFVAVKKLAKLGADAEIAKDTDEVMSIFERIEKETATSVENISRTLKMLNEVAMDYRVFTIEGCIDDAVKKCAAGEISIKRSYEEQKTVVLGNKGHITECFVNVLRNSIESIEQKGESNGKIEISVYTEDDMLLVTVKDNGCGIDQKFIKKAFQPFFTTKNKAIGSGLGLDYVKRVTEIHGGDADIKSAEGEYTSLYIALPIYKIRKRRGVA